MTQMTTVATVRSELHDLYVRESAAIEREFSLTGEGHTALGRRTALVDSMVQRLWNEIIVSEAASGAATGADSGSANDPGLPRNFALVATGGIGRGWLFPHSDIDLQFLYTAGAPDAGRKVPSRQRSQQLSGLQLKLSPAQRRLAE